jgi:hypothetical protein
MRSIAGTDRFLWHDPGRGFRAGRDYQATNRKGAFEPQIIPKYQKRVPLFNDQIISMYSLSVYVALGVGFERTPRDEKNLWGRAFFKLVAGKFEKYQGKNSIA